MGFLVSVTTVLVVVISSVIASDSSSSNSRCSQPKLSGPCSWWSIRYYYDTTSGTCKLFYYGGCYGNENNFQTMADCQSSCGGENICSLPLDTISSCDADQPRFYFDSQLRACRPFRYGGCDGNANNFKTLRECINSCGKDVCRLPKQPGTCKGYIPRFYFDSVTGTCKSFIYGGCQGNANNFNTIEECTGTCERHNVDAICSLPKQTGPCRGSFQRYYFDSVTGTCKSFVYGGCQGNANNFNSIQECTTSCGGDLIGIDTCSLPKETGPCRGSFERFYFDSATGTCESFTYGGCQGNANNYVSVEACTTSCGCLLPKKTGPCRARMPKYYFNSEIGTCQRFIYGGCQANANNFSTKTDCLQTCLS